jgi:hypothetical protein
MVFLIRRRGLLGPFELGLLYGLFFGLGPAAIVVRSRSLAVMEKPFIEAARCAGGSPRWIITHHVVPEVIPHVAVVVLAGVVGALITQGRGSWASPKPLWPRPLVYAIATGWRGHCSLEQPAGGACPRCSPPRST